MLFAVRSDSDLLRQRSGGRQPQCTHQDLPQGSGVCLQGCRGRESLPGASGWLGAREWWVERRQSSDNSTRAILEHIYDHTCLGLHKESCRSQNHVRKSDAWRLLRIVAMMCFRDHGECEIFMIPDNDSSWQKGSWRWPHFARLFPWFPMVSHGFPWFPMVSHGFQANSHVYYPWDTGTGDVEAGVYGAFHSHWGVPQ